MSQFTEMGNNMSSGYTFIDLHQKGGTTHIGSEGTNSAKQTWGAKSHLWIRIKNSCCHIFNSTQKSARNWTIGIALVLINMSLRDLRTSFHRRSPGISKGQLRIRLGSKQPILNVTSYGIECHRRGKPWTPELRKWLLDNRKFNTPKSLFKRLYCSFDTLNLCI